MRTGILIAAAAVLVAAALYFIAGTRTPVTGLPARGDVDVSLESSPREPRGGERTLLRFAFRSEGEPVTDLMNHHARKVHVLIVSEDGGILGHIHPEDFPELNKEADPGKYSVAFAFPDAGRYLISAEGMRGAGDISQQFLLHVAQGNAQGPRARSVTLSQCVAGLPEDGPDRYVLPVIVSAVEPPCPDGYEVSLEPEGEIVADKPVTLALRVRKSGKDIADLQPVMGAGAHIALVPETFDAIYHRHAEPVGILGHEGMDHAHGAPLPSAFGPTVQSETLVFPSTGLWDVYVELKHDGKLIFARFTLQAQ